MTTIVCFGDSNTWGYNPTDRERYPRDVRWTGVLALDLGPAFHVVEEGLSGRTTVWDDPIEGDRNGKRHLTPVLESQAPIDLVILMLGTNDLKRRFSVPMSDIAMSIGSLVQIIKASGCGPGLGSPRILLMAPPPVAEMSEFAEMFGDDARPRSTKFGEYYARVAAEQGLSFLDTGQIIVSSALDGIHFDADQHVKLGHAVAACVREIFEQP